MMMRFTCALVLLCSLASFALTVTEAEYFVDTDPGPGNGIDIPIVAGQEINITDLTVPVAMLDSNKSHGLYIRYKSDDGLWGNTEQRSFFVHYPVPHNYAGREITSAEYWFDDGTRTFFELDDDPLVIHALLLPTSGLQTNAAHRLSVRHFGSHGAPGDVETRWFFIHEPIPGVWYSRDITHVEYQFDNLPPTLVDIGNNFHIDFYGLLPVGGLTPNQNHKFTVRYLDEDGKWSNPEARYFFAIQLENGTVDYYDITHVEYSFDDLNPVSVDISDGQLVNYSELIPSLGLTTNQSHKLSVRYLDSRGYWGGSEARYVFVHETPDGVITLQDLVSMEYWIDSGTPISIDLADAMSVSFDSLVPHNTGAGPHRFNLCYVDESGEKSNAESLPFFVWTGAGPSNPANLAGAEYFLNADPGVGNGVQLNFPQDGTWDEESEDGNIALTGLPVGLHYFGIRFRDEVGNWSMTIADTFVVGPVLVISVSGNNIVLNWNANPDHIPFHVFRASDVGGAYTEIGTSTGLTYSDTGILSSQNKQFYHITTTTNVLSRFRLPQESRAKTQQ